MKFWKYFWQRQWKDYFFLKNIPDAVSHRPSPVATGGFGELSPPNKVLTPQNRNMKHYKSLEILSTFDLKSPRHKRKALPHERKAP